MRNRLMSAPICTMLTVLLAILLMVSGCSALKSKNSPAAPSAAGTVQPAQTKTVYLDFGDVLLPKELKANRNDSFIFSTAGLTAGVLSLKGSVESNSLITFFENRMPEDGWQLISSIKADRSMLLFKKQARWCVIGIEEGGMSTRAVIWVAPTMVMDPSGLNK